jgi:WD40 repeat protein
VYHAAGAGEGKVERAFPAIDTPANFILFHPTSRLLFTGKHDPGGREPIVNRWDPSTGQKVAEPLRIPSSGGCQFFCLSPDGKDLAAIDDRERVVRVYDAATGKPRFPRTGHTRYLFSVAFSPDSKSLASTSEDGTVKLWNLRTGEVSQTLHGPADRLTRSVAFSPDGKLVATAHHDGTVKVWDTTTGKVHRSLDGHTDRVECVTFSPDGRTLASSGYDHTVRLWSLDGGGEKTLRAHRENVRCIAFSPDGRLLASAGGDHDAIIWDLATGTARWRLPHPEILHAIAFLPDGKTVVTGGADRQVRLWSWEANRELRVLGGPAAAVREVAVRADGRMLAACGADGAVHLWDLSSDPPRQKTFQLFPMGSTIWGVAFSPEGRYLATANPDGTAYLLRLAPPGKLPSLPAK